MKSKNWNFLVYVHVGLLLWAVLFVRCLIIPGAGTIAGMLAFGFVFFLFVNIPLAVFSFVLKAKNRLDIQYETTVVVLSVLNMVVGIAAWYFVISLAQSPKFQ